VAVDHVTFPVEFRLGGPARDRLFIYGMVGGALGFAAVSAANDSAVGIVYQPVLLGVGAYGALGNTNLILGGEARTDAVYSAVAFGAPHLDVQIKFGFNFR
jgi:hypothetical protein